MTMTTLFILVLKRRSRFSLHVETWVGPTKSFFP